MKISTLLVLAGGVLAFSLDGSWAMSGCPAPVTAAVSKAHPEASVSSCTREVEKGQTQFEVRLVAKDGKTIELDVSPEGKILVTEEDVDLKDVPPAVLAAFRAKYGSAQAQRGIVETGADGAVTYELAFSADGTTKEATFAADGAFIEEE